MALDLFTVRSVTILKGRTPLHLYTILPKVIHVAEKLFDKHDPEILQQLDIQLNLASTCQQNKPIIMIYTY